MAVQDNLTSDAKGLEVSSAEKRRRLADKVRFRSSKVNSLRGDHHSDEESNEEVQESETPDLKRQLKDRHLQMIAIGQYLIFYGGGGTTRKKSLIACRRNNWNRSVYQQWNGHRARWSSRGSDRIHLCRDDRLLGDDLAGRSCDVHPHRGRLHLVYNTTGRSQSGICHGMDLLVQLGFDIRGGIDGLRDDHPILGRGLVDCYLHRGVLGVHHADQLPARRLLRRARVLVLGHQGANCAWFHDLRHLHRCRRR